MPDRAIHKQQCKQFRCDPHESHVGRSKAAGRCMGLTACRLSTAARVPAKMRSVTHVSALATRPQRFAS